MTRVYADGIIGGDRLPDFLPLAPGWDWYQFSDGTFSSRWIADHPAVSCNTYPVGTIFVCTHCGKTDTNKFVIRAHNRVINQREGQAA